MENNNNSSLVFSINNKRFELRHVDPSTTLLQFLRSQTCFKSPKLSCGEGGCGSCVVLLSKYDSELDKVEDFTVSSCLTLLCSVNGCSITTSEGIGNSKHGFHSIHHRFAGFHASQCGFCTPGMSMSLYGALVNADHGRPQPSPGFSNLTSLEAEKAISGNLCRCTGYRPIADACKSFAADVDIEDLGANSFWNHTHQDKMSRLPAYNYNQTYTFPDFLKRQAKSSLVFNSENQSCKWVVPGSLEELHSLLKETGKVKLVVGNTSMGYYKEEDSCDKYIDLSYVPELSRISNDVNGIKIGAAVTISGAIRALNNYDATSECEVYRKIAAHMEKIATPFIRNTGSIGGNLVMAQRKGFPSDIATLLLAAGCYVEILTGANRERHTLEEFLQMEPLDSRVILTSIQVANWKAESSRFLFETYRASPRPLGNALSHLNSAFLAEISEDESVITVCRLTFGAYGTKHAIRAKKAEEFLTGKKVTAGVVYETIRLIRNSVVVPKGDGGSLDPEYRSSLAVGFLFEFLRDLIEDDYPIANVGFVNGHSDSETSYELDGVKCSRLLSSGKQIFQVHRENHPVGEPITKSGALIQASGEAVYVDDIPSPPDCLHGAFVCSTKAYAKVKDIGFNSKSLPDGVVALLSSKDIPKGGQNVCLKSTFGIETLFADQVAHCAGDLLAFVVADSQKQADAAANLAVVDYDTESLEPPILTVEEAIERSSFINVPPFLNPQQVSGDIARGMAEADYRIINAEMKLNSQYYFYMETHTALAIPDEDKCLVVYTSSQWPEATGVAIAQCLGIPQHNVRVITRRVGGAFGGKAMKSVPIAASCALAAQVLQRPVRMYMNRKTDMIIAGGRHPMEVSYSVGFKSNGKITGLKLDILVNAGMSPDVSAIIPNHLAGSIKKYNWGALSLDIKLCKTNHSSKSAMRAPGDLQGTFIADSVIEHVASTLSMDVDHVKTINLHSNDTLKLFYPRGCGKPDEYTLPCIWDKLAEWSNFKKRREMVKKFNSHNLWRKKGISRMPIIFELRASPTPGKVSILSDGSIVLEVGGVEMGQGLWTKAKQMASFALSSIRCEEDGNSLLERIRVIQADSLSLIQGGLTAGSTKSESTCEAIRLCCNVLVERLLPLKEKLDKETGFVRWEMLISQVEVNLLTGETTILRSDLIYDCGQSLNPAVDMGQIEGAFVQGIGFFMSEEYNTNSEGIVTTDSTWTYKIPTIDTIPKQFNVQILSSGHHQNRVLSSKASGEPPVLLAASVHSATREAIKEARKQLHSWGGLDSDHANFQLDAPATMAVVKKLCGFNSVETHLKWKLNHK
ncbi:Indole-3-acetaldehyde oxidase [Linum perenne]